MNRTACPDNITDKIYHIFLITKLGLVSWSSTSRTCGSDIKKMKYQFYTNSPIKESEILSHLFH